VQNYCGSLQKDCALQTWKEIATCTSGFEIPLRSDLSNILKMFLTDYLRGSQSFLKKKLTVSQLVTISPHFMEPDSSSSYSQQPPLAPIRVHSLPFRFFNFSFILPSTPWSCKCHFPFFQPISCLFSPVLLHVPSTCFPFI